jgi:hypothetical protein
VENQPALFASDHMWENSNIEMLFILNFFFAFYCILTASVAKWFACWPLVPEFAGSNPAEAIGFFLCKKSSASLPPEGKLNNLPLVPTLLHVREPISCGELRADNQILSKKNFPPSLAEGSRAAWCDGASGDE